MQFSYSSSPSPSSPAAWDHPSAREEAAPPAACARFLSSWRSLKTLFCTAFIVLKLSRGGGIGPQPSRGGRTDRVRDCFARGGEYGAASALLDAGAGTGGSSTAMPCARGESGRVAGERWLVP